MANQRIGRHRLAAAAAVLTAATVTGCAPHWPQAEWSQSKEISRTEVLRFMAPADCHASRGFDPTKGDFVYAVIGIWPVSVERRTYRILSQGWGGSVVGTYYVSQWWKLVKTDAAPLGFNDEGSCALLVDVPRSKTSARPYFVPDAEQLSGQFAVAVAAEHAFPVAAVLFAVLLAAAWFGVERQETWWQALGWAAALLIAAAIGVGVALDLPMQRFAQAQAYWEWYDQLPRAGGQLLPLSIENFRYLLQGPPNAFHPYTGTWAIIFGFFSALWLAPMTVFGWRGLYWLITPLPLQQVCDRAAAEGRAPRQEEIDEALVAAVAGKRPWQIEIMRRKAEAFAHRFRGRL